MPARLTAIARDDVHQGSRTARVAERATPSAAPTFMTAGGQLIILLSGALLAGGEPALSGYGMAGAALGFILLLQGHRILTRGSTDKEGQR